MTLDEFHASLDDAAPPAGMDGVLSALWHDARGDWDGAHRAAQAEADPHGARVHAYLHRKEGDLSNAGYWYRRAGCAMPACSLEQEWRDLVAAFTRPPAGTAEDHDSNPKEP